MSPKVWNPYKIFVCYRRSRDIQMVAGRLHKTLAEKFGEVAIFRDVSSVRDGENWKEAINRALTPAVTVFVLIGPNWLDHLSEPNDWRRTEIELALARGACVVPVLVEDTQMPADTLFPESIRQLANIKAIRLRDEDWDTDVQRLSEMISDRKRHWAFTRLLTRVAIYAGTLAAGATALYFVAVVDATAVLCEGQYPGNCNFPYTDFAPCYTVEAWTSAWKDRKHCLGSPVVKQPARGVNGNQCGYTRYEVSCRALRW